MTQNRIFLFLMVGLVLVLIVEYFHRWPTGKSSPISDLTK